MITPMMKYSLVLYHRDYQPFLERLQHLGLVDITLGNLESTEEQRTLINGIDNYRQAIARLKELEKEELKSAAAKAGDAGATSIRKERLYKNAEAAYKAYSQAHSRLEELTGELSKLTKEIEELTPWGAFDVRQVEALRQRGVVLHFYTLFSKEFDALEADWSARYALEVIGRDTLKTYFIVATPADEMPEIEAQPIKTPTADYRVKNAEAQQVLEQMASQGEIVASCIPYLPDFEQEQKLLSDRLHFEKASLSGERQAEDTLILLEGWAPREHEAEVDKALDETGAFYLKERPTPEDQVPVLLKNGKFSGIFEWIGNFYALPQYGSMDLTRYFAPFYMLFFGFCLADAGYGLLLLLGGWYLLKKSTGTVQTVAKLSMLCGAATVVFGFMVGGFFGIEIKEWSIFSGIHDYFLSTDNLFTLALGVGIVQLLFGMTLKVINTTRQSGFKYTLSTLGWMIVIVSTLAAVLLPDAGVQGFTMKSVPYLVCAGVGAFLMFFMNSPGKNPLVNFGAGLWNTYNDVVGLVGDVLSYIRLFAIGLSGGILALVFNQLADGLSPDIPGVKQVVMVLILLIGHGINLFMSTLSSFVHPMRLTFVEFYKAAGFESTQRSFNPLRRTASEE